MKIYTKTGDQGQTSLVGGTRVSKADDRLEAYGTADELNSFVGLLRAKSEDKELDETFNFIQNKLFNLGTVLATEPDSGRLEMVKAFFIRQEDVSYMEHQIDLFSQDLPQEHSFVLPAGNERVALAHVCRTVCRRLERQMVRLLNHQGNKPEEYEKSALQFVNRLSDFFFVASKSMAQKDKCEIFLWKKL